MSFRSPWLNPRQSRSERRPARTAGRRSSVHLGFDTLEDRTVPSNLGVDVVSGDPKDWPMYNHDPAGSRSNSAETRLRADTVSGLHTLWRFETPGAIAGTPAVVNDVVYTADSNANVYAINRNGQELWHTHLPVSSPFGISLTASPLVTNRTLIIGDLLGQIHGVNTNDGTVRWTIRPPSPGPVFGEQHPFQSIFGSPTMVGNYVAIGMSSVEEAAPFLIPGYPGFTFQGSLVLLDPADGRIIWQSFTVGTPSFNPDTGEFGPSGATIWSTPSYDRASNTIYATTGNNYSQPTTATSDAIIAFDAEDGHIKWSTQMTTDDYWNYRYPPKDENDPPDFDFGDSPQIYKLGGRTLIGAGQKSGFYHVVDATTGEIINQYQASPGGSLGGLYADSAVAGGVVFANGSDWPDPFSNLPFPSPYNGGSLTAIKGDGSGQLWSFVTPAPDISGVAVANGVVYFSSIDGLFYALNAANGSVLAQIDTSFQIGDATITGVSSGPAISRGRVYVGLGDTLANLTNPFAVPAGGALLALGIDDALGSATRVHQSKATSSAPTPFSGHGSGSFIDAAGGFLASGIALHLGVFTHYGTLVLTPTNDPTIFSVSGVTTYEAANGDKLYASLDGTLNLLTGIASGTDIWIGGTGRFEDASGSVEVTAVLAPDGTFTFDLIGTLVF